MMTTTIFICGPSEEVAQNIISCAFGESTPANLQTTVWINDRRGKRALVDIYPFGDDKGLLHPCLNIYRTPELEFVHFYIGEDCDKRTFHAAAHAIEKMQFKMMIYAVDYYQCNERFTIALAKGFGKIFNNCARVMIICNIAQTHATIPEPVCDEFMAVATSTYSTYQFNNLFVPQKTLKQIHQQLTNLLQINEMLQRACDLMPCVVKDAVENSDDISPYL